MTNDRNCENCLFGLWAPDRRNRLNGGGDYQYHCTINPPSYPSGHPYVFHDACCALFTERAEPHNQPLRHLIAAEVETKHNVKG